MVVVEGCPFSLTSFVTAACCPSSTGVIEIARIPSDKLASHTIPSDEHSTVWFVFPSHQERYTSSDKEKKHGKESIHCIKVNYLIRSFRDRDGRTSWVKLHRPEHKIRRWLKGGCPMFVCYTDTVSVREVFLHSVVTIPAIDLFRIWKMNTALRPGHIFSEVKLLAMFSRLALLTIVSFTKASRSSFACWKPHQFHSSGWMGTLRSSSICQPLAMVMGLEICSFSVSLSVIYGKLSNPPRNQRTTFISIEFFFLSHSISHWKKCFNCFLRSR